MALSHTDMETMKGHQIHNNSHIWTNPLSSFCPLPVNGPSSPPASPAQTIFVCLKGVEPTTATSSQLSLHEYRKNLSLQQPSYLSTFSSPPKTLRRKPKAYNLKNLRSPKLPPSPPPSPPSPSPSPSSSLHSSDYPLDELLDSYHLENKQDDPASMKDEPEPRVEPPIMVAPTDSTRPTNSSSLTALFPAPLNVRRVSTILFQSFVLIHDTQVLI